MHKDANAGTPDDARPAPAGKDASLAERLRQLTACMAEGERLQVYRAAARLLDQADTAVD